MEKILVIGGGTMGAGIAFVAAHAGYAVDLVEPAAAAQDSAKARIAKLAERAASDAAGRLTYFSAIPANSNALLAIEAIPERLELKRALFRDLAQALGPAALLATNTSSLSVTEIAEGIESPERILGLHFFNPPAQMKLVEIVRADLTSDESLERARAIVERFGKTAVEAADTPGFIANRVARPFYLQSMRAYEAGVAPYEDLDRLARGAGFRMGPFELMDLIGLDVNLATSESVYDRTGFARLEPVALQRELVAQGRLGRKTGAGFYAYEGGRAPERDDRLPDDAQERDESERIVILGYAGVALELHERLSRAYSYVTLLENDDALDDLPLDATIVIDVGDGVNDRGAVIERLERDLPPETVLFVDAYASDMDGMARRMQHPERVVGYGILGSLESQNVVEIVDAESTGDDALELAQELFENAGRRVALVEDRPALFLGRVVGSIVNEAVTVVQEEIATPEDVDLAMQLGTNYPRGPIAWGREIGGDRIARILQRLAGADGSAFAPNRALWVLDAGEREDEEEDAAFND